VTVTVTDKCDDSDSVVIRNTGGSWSLTKECDANFSNPPTYCSPYSCTDRDDIITDDAKWVFDSILGDNSCIWNYLGTSWTGTGSGNPCNTTYPSGYRPSCGSPFGCNTGTGCADSPLVCCGFSPCGSCIPQGYDFYSWEC
jgi:hypothetical protein